MLSLNNINLLRKYKVRFKRYLLGRSYRHMAKISHHFKIEAQDVVWKKQVICRLVPLSHVMNTISGQAAYIVASGPSVNEIDMSLLADKVTFGINGSILKFVESGLPPDFYVICDENFIYNRQKLLAPILENHHSHCFFTPQVLNAICDVNPELLRNHPKISVFHNHFKEYGHTVLEYEDIKQLAVNDPEIMTQDGRIGFSLNPEKGLFTAHTVAYFALQLAYGLGFRQINMIGMDLGGSNGQTRFYESGAVAMPSHLDRDYSQTILPSFKVVSALCQNNQLQVFNCSLHSRLPDSVIPKKSFNAVIKSDLII